MTWTTDDAWQDPRGIAKEANAAEEYKRALQVVAEMRRAQKEYFKKPSKDKLIESKRLETSVDMRLSELEIKAH